MFRTLSHIGLCNSDSWQVSADSAQVHLAACLLAGELDRARFLWKRSEALQGDMELKVCDICMRPSCGCHYSLSLSW